MVTNAPVLNKVEVTMVGIQSKRSNVQEGKVEPTTKGEIHSVKANGECHR